MKLSGPGYSRRAFLKSCGAAAPCLLGVVPRALAEIKSLASPPAAPVSARELAADLVIIGGGVGGCAAALAAARHGLQVVMTEETDWIGGQLTQQAVPPDENKWIETFGGTRSYQALRQCMRDYYRRNYPLTEKARANPLLNPGNCWVSRIGCEPRVALAVLHEMLAPFLGNGRVQLLLQHKAVGADVEHDSANRKSN